MKNGAKILLNPSLFRTPNKRVYEAMTEKTAEKLKSIKAVELEYDFYEFCKRRLYVQFNEIVKLRDNRLNVV